MARAALPGHQAFGLMSGAVGIPASEVEASTVASGLGRLLESFP